MRGRVVTSLAGLAAAGALLLGAQADGLSARAKQVHRRALVVDTHADTTQKLLFEDGYDFASRHDTGHLDLPRMREGGLDAVFFSIYMPSSVGGPEAVKRALRLIDSVRETVRQHPRDLVLARTAAEVRRAHRQGRIAALMGMEGGHMIADDLRVLRMYAALGVRYLTLTHSRNNNWADSSTDTPQHDGLTDFGKDVVRELNRLGVMVDVSHVSDKTFSDALAVSRAPLLASHSSCRALCNAPRNLSDEMLAALARKGGLIQITFVDSFLSQELRDAQRAIRAEREAREREIEARYADNEAKKLEAWDQLNREYRARLPQVGWEKILDHIDHAVKVAGVDHVGLGSDFDGATMPLGMEDCAQLPKITAGLLGRGYSERDVMKILGGNLLRVMEEAEKVSREMQAGGREGAERRGDGAGGQR